MEITYLLGLIGSILVTVAYIPQTAKTLMTRHTKDLSFSWLLILTAGLLMYTVYGIAISSIPVIISSAIGGLLVIILLIFKVIYK